MGSRGATSTPPTRPLPDARLAIDLLNTTWQGADGTVDWLGYDQAVFEFTAAHDHPTKPADLEATRAALMATRNLIERIVASVPLTTAGRGLLDDIEHALQAGRTTLDRSTEPPAVRIIGHLPSNRVAVAALADSLDLVARSSDRLRSCEHEECSLWFLDTSKGGRRRWCSMRTCGNRAKAKRHYHRSTAP